METAIVPSVANGGMVALGAGGGYSVESPRQLMAEQRELFHSQAEGHHPLPRNEQVRWPMYEHQPEKAANVKDMSASSGKLLPSSSLERKMKKEIQWHIPPELKIDSSGEASKEIALQIHRINCEEIYYANQEISPNPKEACDMEIDFDDSLTPDIPIEHPQDGEDSLCPPDCPTNRDMVQILISSCWLCSVKEP